MPFFRSSYAKITCTIASIALIGTGFCLPRFTFAQDDGQEQQDSLQTNLLQLQNELKDIEDQIADYEKNLSSARKKKTTLSNIIATLKKRQQKLTLAIKETQIQLDALQKTIQKTQFQIDERTAELDRLKNDISGILRELQEARNESFLQGLVVHANIGEYLNAEAVHGNIIQSLGEKLKHVRGVAATLREKKNDYDKQAQDAEHALNKQLVQKDQLTDTVTLQHKLLQTAQSKEAAVGAALKISRKAAAKIRGRIYQLFNVGKQITFGQALEIAKWVSGSTGVRPAYLLAILTQESNLGKNVGTCNRADDPPKKNWKNIMKPDRDQQPFLQITKKLRLDPNTTAVSCPMMRNGKRVGWGGAMGPAQFLPSTWLGYEAKVSSVSGKTANPWDIRDAFLASGIKLRAGGADGTPGGEFNASMRYFAGSVNLAFRFYGDNVAKLAKNYQKDIDDLAASTPSSSSSR